MKKRIVFIRCTALLLSFAIILSGCASTTMFQTTPSGAKLYLDGMPVGNTPYTYSDTKIVGSTTTVKLTMDGYEELNTTISRNEEVDVGAIIGGLFIWIPFLWVMKYKPIHAYELIPALANPQNNIQPSTKQEQVATKSKAERLRELKQLLDDKILTQEEYEKEKAKILAEPEN